MVDAEWEKAKMSKLLSGVRSVGGVWERMYILPQRTTRLLVLGFMILLVMIFMLLWMNYHLVNELNTTNVSVTEGLKRIDEITQAISNPKCAWAAQQGSLCPSPHLFPTDFGRDEDSQFGRCEFNVMTDLEYLPEPDFLNCMAIHKPKAWAEAREDMYRRIYAIQNPLFCNNPISSFRNVPVWETTKDENGMTARKPGAEEKIDPKSPKWHLVRFLKHGWAYNLYVFAWSVGNHWNMDIPVIVGNSKYRFSDMKCGRSWSCLWSPLSRCKIEDIDPDKVAVFGFGDTLKSFMTLDQVCKPYGEYSMEYGRCICNANAMPSREMDYFHCAPYSSFDFSHLRIEGHRQVYEKTKNGISLKGDELHFHDVAPGESNPHQISEGAHDAIMERRKEFGFFWEHAHWLWYLHKDAPMRQKLDNYLRSVGILPKSSGGIKPKSIGMHVRHGDSCHDKNQNHRKCFELSVFMEKVEILESKYGKYDLIYLATDDPQVVRDTKKYRDKYRFSLQPIDRKMYETNDDNGVDVRAEFNQPSVVAEIAKDIWALSHCDAFIGSFASSVAWVSYEMMVARNGQYMPFISVDMAWGHRKNVGRFFNHDNY